MRCARVSWKQTKKNFDFRTETNQNKISFAFVSVCFVKPKTKYFALFRCFKPISKQPKQTELFRNKPKQTETNRNNPKFAEKYPNILSFKLFGWVFNLFRFNRNIETLCFDKEAKQSKQIVSKQIKTNRKKQKKINKPKKTEEKKQRNPKFSVKNSKMCSLSNCLFRFNRKIEALFQ